MLISQLNSLNKTWKKCMKLNKELKIKKLSMLKKNKGKRNTEDNKDQQILKTNLSQEDLAQKMMKRDNKWRKMMGKLEIK